MNTYVSFMTGPTGRLLRIVIGLLLVWEGLSNEAGVWVAVIGLVPIAAGVFNFCVLAPFFGERLFPRRALR